MQAGRVVLLCLLTFLAITASALAQEGHPLKGTWLGDWGPTKTQRTPVFIILDWDGKAITGTINPGPDGIPLQKASLEIQKGAPVQPAAAPPAAGRGGGAPPQGAAAPAVGTNQRGAGGPPPTPDTWLVHLEADGKDQAGKAAHIVIDGKIENLGLYNRYIVGTWTQGTTKGDFKITRQ